MKALDGRRLRFAEAGEPDVYGHRRYEVAAVSTSRVSPPHWIGLGYVYAYRASTDRRISGTRLRSPGAGRRMWRAVAPASAGGRELQGTYTRGWRLVFSGQAFETRREAAMALVDWHDHPEKRDLS